MDTPPKADVVQVFPPYIYNALGVVFEMPFFLHRYGRSAVGLSGVGGAVSYDKLPYNIKAKINGLDPNTLRLVGSVENNLIVAPSTVKHVGAGRGVFTTRSVGKGTVVAYFYGTLVYSDLGSGDNTMREYGSGIMSVTQAEFRKYAIDSDVKANFGERTGLRSIYITPAKFCTARYINDPRYLDGDGDKEEHERQGYVRKANVEVNWNKARTRDNVSRYEFLQITATRNISRGDELFLDYATEHVMEENADGLLSDTSRPSVVEEEEQVLSEYSDDEHEAGASDSEDGSGGSDDDASGDGHDEQ